jgi:hypothetical protein
MRHAVALAIAVVAAGCSDSTAPQKSANGGGGNANNGGGGGTVASGTYSLRAIDRKALPYEIHHGPFFDPTSRHFYNQLVVKITKGAIELGPLGDCAIWLDYTLNEDGQVSTKHIETDGSWKMVGNQVTVYVNGNPTAQFTIQNGQVVENADVIPDGTMHEYTFQK